MLACGTIRAQFSCRLIPAQYVPSREWIQGWSAQGPPVKLAHGAVGVSAWGGSSPRACRAKQPGVEQGEAGRGAAGAGSRPGLGSPSRAAPLAEYLGFTPAAAGCPRSPPGVSEGDGPVL